MRLPQFKTRAARLTWLQVLALVVSGAAYLMNSMLTAIVMLFLATIFGIGAMMVRVQEAKQQMGRPPARPRRR